MSLQTRSREVRETSNSDFILLTFFAFVEPDPLPWFPTLSVGKFLTVLWSFASLFLTFFYLCNFRANLATLEFEKTVDDLFDVLKRGETFYVPRDIHELWPDSHKAQNSHFAKSDLRSVQIRAAQLAVRTNGTYSLFKNKGQLPDRVMPDVIRNGASYISLSEYSRLRLIEPPWNRSKVALITGLLIRNTKRGSIKRRELLKPKLTVCT